VAAERVVLGAMMLSREAVAEVLEVLEPVDMYRPVHTTIFTALHRLFVAGEPLDPVALSGALLATGELDRVGGTAYLHTCMEAVPVAIQAGYYARIVKDYAVRRRIREAGVRIIQNVDNPTRGLDELRSMAQEEIFTATAARQRSRELSWGQGIAAALDSIESASHASGFQGLPTWIGRLNQMTGGLRPGQLVVIAGRPGMGKSVFGLDMVRLVGIHRRLGCQMFSLEMTRDEIFQRTIAAELGIPFERVRDGRLGQEEWDRMMAWAADVSEAPIWVDDNSYVDMAYVRTVSRQRAAVEEINLVVVDYLQLMATPGRRIENRQQEVADMSRGLKLLAKELNCVVIAASQLNREVERRADKRPNLSDLRESGAVEQDADIVILLHRPDYYDEMDRPREADMIVAKQRNGPTGDIAVFADLGHMRFRDLDVV